MVQLANDHHPLRGVRALAVEDDPLMAMDLETRWARAGAVVGQPLPDPGGGHCARRR